MATYFALVEREPESGYQFRFPDFPGCAASASGIDEAQELAAEALHRYAEGMLRQGGALPEPTSLEALKDDPANREAFAIRVSLDLEAVLISSRRREPKMIRVSRGKRRETAEGA